MAAKKTDKKKDSKDPRKILLFLKIKTGAIFFSIGLIFLVSGVFIYQGISDYILQSKVSAVVSGLKALQEGDSRKAASIFLKAAQKGNKTAAVYLSWIEAKRGNFRKSLDFARMSVEGDETKAAFEIMGDLALIGYGQATGAGPALFYFNELVKTYPEDKQEKKKKEFVEKGILLSQKINDYIRLVNTAIVADSSSAKLRRGDIEFLGEDQVLSPNSAIKSWEEAEREGVAEALTRRAGVYWNGYGVQRDYDQAIKYYREASKEGDPAATYALGLISLRVGLESSYSEAMKLFKEAARKNYAPAMTAIAVMSLANNLDNKDTLVNAAALFEKAHELGDHTASIFFVLMLHNGEGIEIDIDRALAILYDLKSLNLPAVDGMLTYLTYINEKPLVPVFGQLVKLVYKQLCGEYHFTPGAYEGAVYHDNKSTLNYFTPPYEDKNIKDSFKKKLGNNYIAKLDFPEEVRIDGNPLLFPEMIYVLEQSEPGTFARQFVPPKVITIDASLPDLPPEYESFGINISSINTDIE